MGYREGSDEEAAEEQVPIKCETAILLVLGLDGVLQVMQPGQVLAMRRHASVHDMLRMSFDATEQAKALRSTSAIITGVGALFAEDTKEG